MHKSARLTAEQRSRFLREGYLIVPGRLSPGLIQDLLEACEEEEKKQSPPVSLGRRSSP